MSTVTAQPRTTKSRPFTCELVGVDVVINGTIYAVERIEAGECGTLAFRLTKHAGHVEVYDVIRTHDGIVACDCPDYVCRHEGNGYGTCKHGRALVQLGLMPAPGAPVAESDPVCCPADEAAPCVTCGHEVAVVVPTEVSSEETSVLPRIDGTGLTPDEFARLFRWTKRAREAYQRDEREASLADVERVATIAAKDALRSILRARPVAVAVVVYDDETMEFPDIVPVFLASEIKPCGVSDETEHLLSLAELVEVEVQRFRSRDNEAGDLMADALAELARQVRAVDAVRPDQVEERLSLLDRDYSGRGFSWRIDNLLPEPELMRPREAYGGSLGEF